MRKATKPLPCEFLSPEGEAACGEAYWLDLFDHAPAAVAFIECFA